MKGKSTALVTGATTGIGLELAKLLARDCHDLVLVARGAEKLDALADILRRDYGAAVKLVVKDLSEPGAAKAVFDAVEADGLKIDVLVNNAGVGVYGEFAKSPLAEETRMIALNVTALTELTKLFLPGMLARREGRIMNVASTAAFQPGPLMAVYYATKAYVLSFSEALSEELRGAGVTVTALCPGATATEFQSRANMNRVALIKYNSMSAGEVARIGYRGMMKGKAVVVTGLFNRFGAFAVRFAPRRVVTRIVRLVMSEV